MEYRILGKTGIKVSAIGIGGGGFENKIYRNVNAFKAVEMGLIDVILLRKIKIN